MLLNLFHRLTSRGGITAERNGIAISFITALHVVFIHKERLSGVIGKWTALCPKRRGTEGTSTDVSGPKHGHGHDEKKPFHDYTSGNVSL